MVHDSHKIIDDSFRSILRVSVPLIISSFADNLLILIDRVILAFYSLDSMNAAAISGNLIGIFCFVWICIASTAEVFVGQHNGAKNFTKLAEPVWQMIYLSLFAAIILFPLGYYAKYINFFPSYFFEEGVIYQKWLTYFAFIPGINAALSAFFIGQGKTFVIIISVLVSVILNACLDYMLIFGVEGIAPCMGIKGAAIATIISEIVRTIILAVAFLNTKNRKNYNTLKARKFNRKIFLSCLKIGSPLSIGTVLELGAWYIIHSIISNVSKDMATIHGISVSFYFFFAFIADGLRKSSATISANLIGQDKIYKIKNIFIKFVILILVMASIFVIPIILSKQLFFNFFNQVPQNFSELYPQIRFVLNIIVFNIIIEAIGAFTWGILLSGGDTKYPMFANIASLWGIVVIPVSVLFFLNNLTSVPLIYLINSVYCLTSTALIYFRYKSNRWKNKLV